MHSYSTYFFLLQAFTTYILVISNQQKLIRKPKRKTSIPNGVYIPRAPFLSSLFIVSFKNLISIDFSHLDYDQLSFKWQVSEIL